MTQGAALRRQSLDPQIQSYWDFRDRFARDLRRQNVKVQKQEVAPLLDYAAATYHLNPDTAAEYLERFLSELKNRLHSRKPS